MQSVLSKDLLDTEKVMKNFHTKPADSLEELTRIMVEDIQRVQLGDMESDFALRRCAQLKAASNNVISAWTINHQEKAMKIKHIDNMTKPRKLKGQ